MISGNLPPNQTIHHIDDALIHDISAPAQEPQYLTVSYPELSADGTTTTKTARFIVNNDTVIVDRFGHPVDFSDIQPQTHVNVQYSGDLTDANPPEAPARLIVVQQSPDLEEALTTTDWVASVDSANGLLYTGNPNSINSQHRYIISNATEILDHSGNIIPLQAIEPGQIVRITHSPFQQGCIPPQATAYVVQLF